MKEMETCMTGNDSEKDQRSSERIEPEDLKVGEAIYMCDPYHTHLLNMKKKILTACSDNPLPKGLREILTC